MFESAADAIGAAEAEATRMFENFKKMTDERDQLQARVVELRVALAVRDAERDALQARVAASPCLGIEIEPGWYSGCSGSGGDCPICGK